MQPLNSESGGSSLFKYALLDRDGTLIHEPADKQIDRLEKLTVLEGVIEGLQELKKMGYKLLLVSNQDGLGTPLFPLPDFEKTQRRMLEIFEHHGITFEALLICPHLAGENCRCRKPNTGLVDEFLRGTGETIDWKRSFVCGDRESDRLFALNLGARFILMETNGVFTNVLRQLSGDH
jgi:imidazoleglycerol-phosphate dehydratase/histidinol-phosphatase